jgi:hypothetical protein
MPRTKPLDDTVAMALLLLLHVTFWFVASDGATMAVMASLPPTGMSADRLSKATPVTGISNSQAAVKKAVIAHKVKIIDILNVFFIRKPLCGGAAIELTDLIKLSI